MKAVKTLPPFKTNPEVSCKLQDTPCRFVNVLLFILKMMFWTVIPSVAIMLEKEMEKSRLLLNIYH